MKPMLLTAALFFLLLPAMSSAQTYYVREGASGSGSDWANAYGSLPPTLQRGATYYIADGAYSGYTFDDAGTTVITIKKATTSDHGTGTGWSSSYGDGQAVLGQLVFSAGYYTIDGAIGGGPGSWETGFGIKIQTSQADMIHVPSGTVSNVMIRHVDVAGDAPSMTASGSNKVGFRSTTAYIQSFTFSYCYIHDIEDVHIFTRGSNYLTIEYSKIARNVDIVGDHKEFWSGTNEDNAVLRYNIFEDIINTAFIGFVNGDGTTSNMAIYGNVFWHKPGSPSRGVSQLVEVGSNEGTLQAVNWKFYNNAIVNVNSYSTVGFYLKDGQSGFSAYNNLFYSNIANACNGVGDYNWYYGNIRVGVGNQDSAWSSDDGGHSVVGSGNPFVDWENGNFRLAAATSAGYSLTSPYNTDPDGKTRGSDGTWDRGAYEYGGSTSCTSHASYSCYSGDVYWYNSCGTLEGLKEDCGSGTCSGGACQAAQTCGNNIREGTEICDGTDLAGQTCITQGFSDGTLSCNNPQCTGFVTTSCTSPTPTCQSQGYQCCPSCVSGPQPGYDPTCSSGQVCCQTCQTTGELAWFRFDDDPSDGVLDSSGQGNHGTCSSCPVYLPAGDRNGGGAYQFDNTNDYISADAIAGLISGYPFTFAAWIKTSSADYDTIVAMADPTSNNIYYEMQKVPDGRPIAVARIDSSWEPAYATMAANDGQWHHVAAVFTNGIERRIYVDGGNAGANITSKSFASANNLNIGRLGRLSATNYFSGLMDDVRIYDNALTQGEIQSLMSDQSYHKSDTNQDGCVSNTELTAFIDRWKLDNADVTIRELIEAIGLWKKGC